MKRFRMFLVMISAVLFSGVLSSCSKDEDFEANLAGYWYDSNTTYYLNGNGTGERTIDYPSGIDDQIDEFTWEATGDIISFTYQQEINNSDYPESDSYKYVLTDKYLILTGFDGSGKWVLSKNKK